MSQKKYGFSSGGCVVRIGTTCKEMTPEQIKIIDDEYMVKKRSSMGNLSFRELKIYYTEKGFHLSDSSIESNLNLRNKDGQYNLLAELLADRNNIPFIFVKFNGTDKSTISERNDYGYGCILSVYEKLKSRLQAENTCISDTTVRPRKDTYLFDYDCVNEAVMNALVHNDWTITEPQISMFSNRIEILSHGGLPHGMTKQQFFDGISHPRNATLMRIFLNMGLTEHTGHGIPTIVRQYSKDVFEIADNYIRCVIPFDEKVAASIENVGLNVGLNKTEKAVLALLIGNPTLTAESISEQIGVTKRTIERALSELQRKDKIKRLGSRRDGSWKVVG